MTKVAQSVLIFGIYLVLLGTSLIGIPNVILEIFGEPTTEEVWIRVVGVLVLLIGCLYIQSARKNIKEIFVLTVYGRSNVFIFFTAFVLLEYASPILILFGVVDICGAIWTFKEIKKQRQSA